MKNFYSAVHNIIMNKFRKKFIYTCFLRNNFSKRITRYTCIYLILTVYSRWIYSTMKKLCFCNKSKLVLKITDSFIIQKQYTILTCRIFYVNVKFIYVSDLMMLVFYDNRCLMIKVHLFRICWTFINYCNCVCANEIFVFVFRSTDTCVCDEL